MEGFDSDDDDDGAPILVNVDDIHDDDNSGGGDDDDDDDDNNNNDDAQVVGGALKKKSPLGGDENNKNKKNNNDGQAQQTSSSFVGRQQQEQQQEEELLPPCPVTILSGFLGSGKTTLIQYILKSPNHGKRIAVIENEFGEGLAIESLIARDGINDNHDNNNDENNNNNKSSSLMDLIELPNGCLCCTVKDSLVVTLESLLMKRRDLDYILIECSGMANPGPIATVFWLDEALESRLRLDGIVTLCDARHITQQLQETHEAAQQLAYADRILLNKIDLIMDNHNNNNNDDNSDDNKNNGSMSRKELELDRITQLIRQFHPTAPIHRTCYASVPDLDWILDAQCFDSERVIQQLELEQQQQNNNSNKKKNNNNHHNHETTSEESHSVSSSSHNHHHDHDDDDNDEGSHDCSICNSNNDPEHHHHHDHHHHHSLDDDHRHTQDITTISLVRNGSVDRKRMDQWLNSIVGEYNNNNNNTIGTPITTSTTMSSSTSPSNPHSSFSQQQQQQQAIYRIKGILSLYQTPESADYDPDWLVPSDLHHHSTQEEEHDDDETTTPSIIQRREGGGGGGGLDQRRYIVQGVYDLWEIHPASSSSCWGKQIKHVQGKEEEEEEEERCCKLVVIGRFLNRFLLQSGFDGCFLSS